MTKVNDLVGTRFGNLTVIGESESVKDSGGSVRRIIKVLCDCGNTAEKKLKYLKSGETKKCGNCKLTKVGETPKGKVVYLSEVKNSEIALTGTMFGYWKVDSVGYTDRSSRYCKVVCNCGTISFVETKQLTAGISKSCGCYSSEVTTKRNTIHGMSHTLTFIRWQTMLMRCSWEKGEQYHDYGGRGIDVCEEWKSSFENFYRDMGECSEGMSLDRINLDKGYNKENCRWADNYTQAYNQRKRSTNTSGKTGVNYDKNGGVWVAGINFKGEHIYLGRYKRKEDAVKARENAEIKYYGELKGH